MPAVRAWHEKWCHQGAVLVAVYEDTITYSSSTTRLMHGFTVYLNQEGQSNAQFQSLSIAKKYARLGGCILRPDDVLFPLSFSYKRFRINLELSQCAELIIRHGNYGTMYLYKTVYRKRTQWSALGIRYTATLEDLYTCDVLGEPWKHRATARYV